MEFNRLYSECTLMLLLVLTVMRVNKKIQYDFNSNKYPEKELSYGNDSKSCEVVLLPYIALWYTYLVHREHVLHRVGTSIYIR